GMRRYGLRFGGWWGWTDLVATGRNAVRWGWAACGNSFILPHHGGLLDRFQSCRKVAQHFRFIGELQPDQLVGPLFDGDQAVGDEIHVVVGVDPARNSQAN